MQWTLEYRLNSELTGSARWLPALCFILCMIFSVPKVIAQAPCQTVKCGPGFNPPVVVIAPGLGQIINTPQAYPSCSDWPDCNNSLPSDITASAYPPYDVYVHDSETDHFTFFTDPNSPLVGTYDPAEIQIVKDQLECGYRYFVCHLGMPAPNEIIFPFGEKSEVYIGDNPNSAGTTGRITLGDYLVTGNGSHKLFTTPVHEFFHLIQGRSYINANSGYEDITEGLATVAEQMVSYDNLEKSFDGILRSLYISIPYDPGSYANNLLIRYLGEQLAGSELNQLELDQDWGMDILIEQFLLQLEAYNSANIPLSFRGLLESVFNANVTVDSYVQNFEDLLDNFVTALYSFRHINSHRAPIYAFTHQAILENATPSSVSFSSGELFFFPGTIHIWDNSNTVYSPFINGFAKFLHPEFHRLNMNYTFLLGLAFRRDPGSDSDIRYQLITRTTNGSVTRQMLFENGDTEDVFFPPNTSLVEELVIAVYSVAESPSSPVGVGQFYHFEAESF